MKGSITIFFLVVISINVHLMMHDRMTNTMKDENIKSSSDSLLLKCLIKEPQVKSAKKRAIVLLHGVGSNEQDLFGLADSLPEDLLIISARGLFTLGHGRHAWYNVDFSTGKPVIKPEQEAISRKAIIAFLEQVKEKYKLDEIYLGGFSQGAIMSYSVGLTVPHLVNGIVVLSGRLLEEIKPLVTKNGDLKKLEVFIAHGVQDGTLPIHYAREAKVYLQTMGIKLSYHEYQSGHQVSEQVLEDVNMWIAN
jgi:phospholipase/carboxylesterase